MVDSLSYDLRCSALNHQSNEVWIPSDELTIWIDPLDATKEYTGSSRKRVEKRVFTAERNLNILFDGDRKLVAICDNYGLHSPQRRTNNWSHTQTFRKENLLGLGE